MKFIEGEHFSDELTRDKFIRDMNNLIAETRQTAIRLFDVFNNAHNTLSSYHFEQFVNAIDLEKSTVNKMKKICFIDDCFTSDRLLKIAKMLKTLND